MLSIKKFTFGPFQENTFLLFNETNQAVIIDPGCYSSSEQSQLLGFIQGNNLKLQRLLNTHCHVDHIAGNRFIYDQFGLKPWFHENDMPVFQNQKRVSDMYGLPCDESPQPEGFLSEKDMISIGEEELEIIFTPGHSPGHVVFYNRKNAFLINGDVLFQQSIGRTDLPLCNHQDLIQSIKNKLFLLPDETRVYCGHGSETTIGVEKIHNPFLQD
jgi:glyoxylase-like metal-dependent hydrolase (beta-lactamase superfamily II)